jgi:hypothetical protein
MRPLSVRELLDVWERGLVQSGLERALLLLAAGTGEGADVLAQLSLGQRDARLLTLRELTFGPQLLSVSACPACGERMEATFNVADLRALAESEAPDRETPEVFQLQVNGYEIRFRLPNSLDQAALASCLDVATARDLLLGRCLLTALHEGAEESAAKLPPDVLDLIAQRMEEADPQADIQLKLSCHACAHPWQEAFDIGSFFWRELEAWANRLLIEVHTLAKAYGWSENDILSLSAARRQFYLNLVSARS